jgi:hypothetical protein
VKVGFHPRSLAGGKDHGGKRPAHGAAQSHDKLAISILRYAISASSTATQDERLRLSAHPEQGPSMAKAGSEDDMTRFPFDVGAFDLDGTLADHGARLRPKR